MDDAYLPPARNLVVLGLLRASLAGVYLGAGYGVRGNHAAVLVEAVNGMAVVLVSGLGPEVLIYSYWVAE